MSKVHIQTYLRTHRKRAGLSQREVAFLTGTSSGTKVARHEGATRPPSLKVGLRYEALFGVAYSELFPRQYQRASLVVYSRAIFLLRKLKQSGRQDQLIQHKRRFLEALIRRVR